MPAIVGALSHFRPSMVNSESTYKFNLLSKYGEMSEWSKVHAWKACVVKATAGSNPVLSAIVLSFVNQKNVTLLA